MLHAAMKAVDIALLVLPAIFALMIAHDFIIYVGHQRHLSQSPAQRQKKTATAKIELQKPAPAQVELPGLTRPDLSQLKRYKLHGQEVVMIEDLPMSLPAATKAYRLRGKECVRLADLEAMTTSH